MTNFEKLKELKNWELAQILDAASCHVDTALSYPGAQVSDYDNSREWLRWLNQPYDGAKGFMFLLNDDSEEETYITLPELRLKKDQQIFKGILKKNDLDTSKQPVRTLGKYSNDYLIFKNGEEIEFFAEDGNGYTNSDYQAGVFTYKEVEYFNAKIVDGDGLSRRKYFKYEYLAISVLDFLHLKWGK